MVSMETTSLPKMADSTNTNSPKLFLPIGLLVVFAYSAFADPLTHIHKLTDHQFQSFIGGNNVRLVFFKRKVEPSHVITFLRDYQTAAKDLKAYGIKLGLVECSHVSPEVKYCTDDDQRQLYGFKESSEKIALPLDTLYDDNSIVSSALHLTLMNSVPIIQKANERKDLENHCKNRCAIVFTFQRILGTHEHRVFIEAAFAHLEEFVFALTTTEMATIGLRRLQAEGDSLILEEPSVWVLHCDRIDQSNSSQDCPQTNYRQQMELEPFLHFLQILHLPDWIEIPPLEGDSIHPQLFEDHRLHVVFFLYDESCKESVLSLVPRLGVWFKGTVGIVTVDLDQVPPEAISKAGFSINNVKPPSVGFKEFGRAQIVAMNEYDNAFQFIVDQLQFVLGQQEIVSVFQNTPEPIAELDELQQDDEVAQALHKQQIHKSKQLVKSLTDATYNELIKKERKFALVLFYLQWNSISQIALQTFANLEHASPNIGQFLLSVECFDWTDVCLSANVTTYPTIHILQDKNEPITYRGILSANSLAIAIQLHLKSNPVVLTDSEHAKSFAYAQIVHGNKSLQLNSVTIIGLSNTDKQLGQLVRQVGEDLRGKHLVGICYDLVCLQIMNEYSVDIPFLITFKPMDEFEDHVILKGPFPSKKALIKFIQNSTMEIFTQLTTTNFMDFLKLNIPLVILFRIKNQNRFEFNLLGRISASKRFSHFSFVWMDLEQQVSRNIQLSLLGDRSSNLSLILINHNLAKWYLYQKNDWKHKEVEVWLQLITLGAQTHSGVLADGNWTPRLPGFDYLKFIEDDEVREVEDKFNSDMATESLDDLHQSRIYRYPGSSEKKYKRTMSEEMTNEHNHYEL